MKRSSLVVAFAAFVALGGTTSAADDPEPQAMLAVCEDDSTLEQQLRQYLKATVKAEATFTYADSEEKDLVLIYTLNPGGDVPNLRIFIDTLVSGRNQAGEVTERCFKIAGCFVLDKKYKTPLHRLEILELNNAFMQSKWMPHRVVLDKDGDVVLENFVNIPGKDTPIHASAIVDILVRNVQAWEDYYKRLAEVLEF